MVEQTNEDLVSQGLGDTVQQMMKERCRENGRRAPRVLFRKYSLASEQAHR